MSEHKKEKPVLMTIDNVRIVKDNDLNVMVERLEKVVNPSTKEVNDRWRFKGYSTTIAGALRLIVRKELLIDRSEVNNLESYLEQVEASNTAILEVIDT